jgi:hypothetical protein
MSLPKIESRTWHMPTFGLIFTASSSLFFTEVFITSIIADDDVIDHFGTPTITTSQTSERKQHATEKSSTSEATWGRWSLPWRGMA